MKKLLTTIVLLSLIATSAQAVTVTYDSLNRISAVSPLTLSDGNTYTSSIEYNIPLDNTTSPSGLSALLNTEAANKITSEASTGLSSQDPRSQLLFGAQLQNTPTLFLYDAAVFRFTNLPLNIVQSSNPPTGISTSFPNLFIGRIVFTTTNNAIPEPVTATLLLAGTLAMTRRRRVA